MNILQIAQKVPFPPIDGSAVAISNMSIAFARQGHSVQILAVNTPKHYSEANEIISDSKSIPIQKVFINTNISVLKLLFNLVFSRIPYISKRFYTKSFKKKLISLLSNNKFDVVQIEGVFMMQYASIIKKYSKAIISLRSHNIENEIWYRNAKNERSFIKKLYLKNLAKRVMRFEKSIINKYDLLVPITQRDLDKLNEMGNESPTFLAPFGIDTDKCKPYISNDAPMSLFFLGALDWIPNQEGLVWFLENVWPDIIENNKDIKFNIAGRNSPEWLIKNINNSNAFYKGEVSDAYRFIKSNGIMLVPLFAGSGMRVKIIEGMALQKAIISTDIGVEGINIENEKNILIANTKEEFVLQINKLFKAPNLINELGKSANNFVTKKFDNFAICDGLLKFYGGFQNNR